MVITEGVAVGPSAVSPDEFLVGDRTCFSSNIKLIWIFNTYIPDGAEKAAQRADFPGHPVYDVLKNPSPIARKICATRTRQLGA